MLTFKGKDQNGTVWDIVICGNKVVMERDGGKIKIFHTTSFEGMTRTEDNMGNELLQNMFPAFKQLVVPQGTFMEILHTCIGFGNQK